jgi:CRP-like cAMP-binding protein
MSLGTPQEISAGGASLPGEAAAELVRALVPAGRRQEAAPGGRLFSFGDRALGVYLILKGTVRAWLPGGVSQELVWGTAGPGSVLGLPSALCAKNYQFDVEAVEAVEAIFVETERVNLILRRRPDLCMQVMRMMCDELSALKQTRDHMAGCAKHGCALHGSCKQAAGLE